MQKGGRQTAKSRFFFSFAKKEKPKTFSSFIRLVCKQPTLDDEKFEKSTEKKRERKKDKKSKAQKLVWRKIASGAINPPIWLKFVVVVFFCCFYLVG